MHVAQEPESHCQQLHSRMKDSFTPMYQTILSIIQAVALADLAAVVVINNGRFTAVHWLLIMTTFFVLIAVLNVYMIQSTVWDWVPDVRDAAIPFVFGALELFLVHTIVPSMSLWLLGMAGIAILGSLGALYMVWRAREEEENAELLHLLKGRHRLFIFYYLGGALLLLLLALACSIEGLSATNAVQGVRGMLTVGVVLLVDVSLAGSIAISHLYWRKILQYSCTGQISG